MARTFCALVALVQAQGASEPVIITKQPPSGLTVVEFDDPMLSVDVTGTDLRYRWFREGSFLPGQTNRSLTVTNIRTSQAGTYYVVVSNAVSSVRSSNSVITVLPDTFGPAYSRHGCRLARRTAC